MIARVDSSQIDLVFAFKNVKPTKFTIQLHKSASVYKVLVVLLEPVRFVQVVLDPPLTDNPVLTAVLMKNSRVEDVLVCLVMLITLLMFVLPAMSSAMDF